MADFTMFILDRPHRMGAFAQAGGDGRLNNALITPVFVKWTTKRH